MHVKFITDDYYGNRLLEITDARPVFRNFEGRPDQFTREGDRSFSIIIPDQEIADALMEDKNEFGVGWNVKIKPPREDGDEPFMHMKVKVKFNGRGPQIEVVDNGNIRELDAESSKMLDEIDIDHMDLYVRPYDDEGRFGPFRSAYLQAARVYMRRRYFAD